MCVAAGAPAPPGWGPGVPVHDSASSPVASTTGLDGVSPADACGLSVETFASGCVDPAPDSPSVSMPRFTGPVVSRPRRRAFGPDPRAGLHYGGGAASARAATPLFGLPRHLRVLLVNFPPAPL